VSSRTAAKLVCDYVAPDTGQPVSERFCHAEVNDGLFNSFGARTSFDARTPGLPEDVYLWTAADARRAAKKLGWAVNVKISILRKDFCPDHRAWP